MNKGKNLVLLVVTFLVPVFLAKVALEQNWFHRGVTNKGQLLQPYIDISPLYASQSESKAWRLLYVIPERCEQPCQNALYSLNQVWLALGRENSRVIPLAVITENSDSQVSKWLSDYPAIQILASSEPRLHSVFRQQPRQGIYIADTLDNMILRYPLDARRKQTVLLSRNILADVKKLLKLSHIG